MGKAIPSLTIICIIMLLMQILLAQKKWTGGNLGDWNNNANWNPAGVPSITDDVIFDNSSDPANYTVALAGNAVVIHSLLINPAPGKNIKLVLPSSNISSPALTLTGEDDAIIINSGGIFQNSSGLSSGQSLNIAGKLRINNGGRYVHNTKSAHANDIVAKLSVVAGTEEGEFEFDVPAASTTISLSNRVYGKLKLSPAANGGTAVYSGSGINPLIIHSDLEISPGVSFSISFGNTVTINRNLIQNGGIFNLANAANSTVLAIKGDVIQQTGTITKSGTAIPTILLDGNTQQQLDCRGTINGDIILKLDNAYGAILKAPLSLPYRLHLVNGKLNTSPGNLLTLSVNCSIVVDSSSHAAFINGPLKKVGLKEVSHFLFPVGKGSAHRWVELKNVTGNFTVEYLRLNPYSLSIQLGPGIDHISSIECWLVTTETPGQASAKMELSFDNVNSGGVTDLNELRAAQLVNGQSWDNSGNTGFSGSAGSSGSVISDQLENFKSSNQYFALASSVPLENTLPATSISFSVKQKQNNILLNWNILTASFSGYFLIEGSTDGKEFQVIKNIPAEENTQRYEFLTNRPFSGFCYYRIKACDKNGLSFYSKTLFIPPGADVFALFPSITRNEAKLVISSRENTSLLIMIYDEMGRTLKCKKQLVLKGINTIYVNVVDLPRGIYIACAKFDEGRTNTVMFWKE